jgi:spore germination cell wall hydrolase CwlJ-like protein
LILWWQNLPGRRRRILAAAAVLGLWAVFALIDSRTRAERILTAVLIGEAGGEGKAGMEAVADVILNRHLASGRTMIDVVLEPSAFSCLNNTRWDLLFEKAAEHSRFREARTISKLLLHHPEALPRRVGGADHYARSDVHPYWAEGVAPEAVVGNHTFWKLDR